MLSKSALRRASCLASAAVFSIAVSTMPALAQSASSTTTPEKPTNPDTIVVTGTRVSTKVADQPVQTISGQTLNDLGYTNVGEALTTLPIFGTPANSTIGGQGSYGAGQTFINLYNLGSQRTLTLVNGNRFVGAATSSIFGASVGTPVDLAEIAPSLIDHVDIVSVGGAPIYGADAIAGTVNLVLKRDYNGIEMTASNGVSGQGDAQDYNFSVLVGHNFAGGRGNVTLNVYYDHQDGLTTEQRAITGPNAPFFQAQSNNSPYQQVYYGGLRYNPFTSTGIPLAYDSIPFYFGPLGTGVYNNAGQTLYFNKAGQLVPFVNGQQTGNGIVEAGGSGFPINDFGNLLTDSNRIQGTLLWHYDIADNIRVHGEVWWGRNQATNVAAQPYYSTNLFGPAGSVNGNLALSTANPFLSPADRAAIQSAIGTPGQDGTFYLERANTDLETGSFTSTEYLFRIVGGLDGDFSLGTHHFAWSATVNYGRTTTTTDQRELTTQNFFNAIGEQVSPSGVATGTTPCFAGYTNATIATLSSTCAPLDVFGVGNASQAAINYVTAIAQTHQLDTQFDFVADVKGDIVHLPGGDVKAALGIEGRRESQNFDPGAFYLGQLNPDGSRTQYGNSTPIIPVAGSYHTHEVFGELTVPFIGPDQHIPLIHDLSFHGAARYTDNSLNGGSWSYTAGGNYAPVTGFTFRGNFTRSYREPSVTEAFAPVGTLFEDVNDPCDHLYINSGPNPAARAANCASQGLSNFTAVTESQNIPGTGGGNPHLKNEVANSWTAGVQADPKFIPGLHLTADYVSISIYNEITQPGLTAELDACYDSTNFPNSPYCSTFSRNFTAPAGSPQYGQITTFVDDYSNISVEAFRALQLGLSYRLPLSRIGLPEAAGSLNMSGTYLHTYRHYTKVGTQDQELVLGDNVDPVDSAQGNFDWSTKRFDWLWTVIFYGPTVQSPNSPDSNYEYPRISPYWMFNTSVGVHVNEHFDLRLVVNNVFNLGLPQPGVYTGGTNKYYEAIMGRYFRLTAKVRF